MPSGLEQDVLMETFRWDFVTDPPTRLLAELQVARARLHAGQYKTASRAARRLLRHLDARQIPDQSPAAQVRRLFEIRADGLALGAIAASLLEQSDGSGLLADARTAFDALLNASHSLRPSSSASYGMVLALSGGANEAVDPLIRAVNAGESVLLPVVHELARRLMLDGSAADATRLLHALQARYPRSAAVAIELATACDAAGEAEPAADAHVAAGALCAGEHRYELALEHFAQARATVPGHPLAALGGCQALLAVGRIAEAVEALEELRRTQPALAGSHAVLALALAQQNRLPDALATVHEALGTFPDDSWLLDTRIRLLFSAGRREDALDAADRALQIDPTDREWRSLRAEILLLGPDDTDIALDILRELADTDPDSVTSTVRLARALQAAGRHRQALDAVQQGLVRHPDEATLLDLQLALLNTLGRPKEAAARAREAVAHGVPRQSVAAHVAEAMVKLDRFEEAISAADEALAERASPRARRVRGLAYQRLGRYREAVADLERIEAEADAEARVALAASLAELASRDMAQGRGDVRARFERAVELDPGNTLARLRLAEILRRSGDPVAALQHANLGLEAEPDNPALLGTRGQILEAMDQDDEAEADLRRAVELDGSLGWAQTELGDFLRVNRRFDEALSHLDRAIEVNPDDPWPQASRGAALYSLDRYGEALESLDRALTLQPDYPWAYSLKAAVLNDIDELPAARENIDRGIALNDSMAWARGISGWLHIMTATDHEDAESAHRAAEDYSRALEIDPDVTDALIGLAEADLLLGDDPTGTELLQRATAALRAKNPEVAGIQAAVGWCELRLGRHEQAIDALVHAIALDTTHISAAFDLALTLLCAGRVEVALEEYDQAIARTRAVGHSGRRRALVHVARRDLNALARVQLADRPDAVDEVRRRLSEDSGGDRASSTGSLQVPRS